LGNSLDGNYSAQASQSLSSLRLRDYGLAPLDEHEAAAGADAAGKQDPYFSPTFGAFSDNGAGLQRSASAAQVRDLKDQMLDLKGKISSLRQQARVDMQKRRSMQSLRTPSPFTHAQVDQWYAGTTESESASINVVEPQAPLSGVISSINEEEENLANGHEQPLSRSTEDEDSIYSEVVANTPLRPPGARSPERNPVTITVEEHPLLPEEEVDEGDISDMHTENGDYQDAIGEVDEIQSESGDSLYHDTVQNPISSISHEDREDAFDYEHFFLHSAMGTLSRQRAAGRSSFSSDSSVETTRGPGGRPMKGKHRRNDSQVSVSTMESFETANDVSDDEKVEAEKGDTVVLRNILQPQTVTVPPKRRSRSPETATRGSFSPPLVFTTANNSMASLVSPAGRHSTGSIMHTNRDETKDSDGSGGSHQAINLRSSAPVFRRPASGSMHRPSVSSFESIGTNRSFPLVNRTKPTPSPRSESHDELAVLSESLMSETASICEQQQQRQHSDGDDTSSIGDMNGKMHPHALQTLHPDDRILVERLVAGLGRCVLALAESGKASTDARIYRRRIDAAKNILEGHGLL
jgi:hypothetical protein